jgi:hypothetical protein
MNNTGRSIVVAASLLLALSLSGFAGETKMAKKDLPAAVVQAFEKAYPKAVIKGAAKEMENGVTCYEIESTEGTIGRDIIYTVEGKAIEIEETLTAKELPDAVAKVFAKEAHGKHATKIEKTTKGEAVTYEFTMGKGKALVIDPSGKLVKQPKAAKENKEEEKEEEGEKD